MVAETDRAYAESGVVHRVRVLGAATAVRYVEAWGRLEDDLHRLRDPNDGYLDEVHEMRDRRAADIVILMVRDWGIYSGGNRCAMADSSGPTTTAAARPPSPPRPGPPTRWSIATAAGALERGDPVSFRTSDGFYLRASLGGTRGVDARGTNAGPWERFEIRDDDGDQIRTGDYITLQALTGHYVTRSGGGLRADQRTAAARETFRIALSER